jgi:hypothetical protein
MIDFGKHLKFNPLDFKAFAAKRIFGLIIIAGVITWLQRLKVSHFL